MLPLRALLIASTLLATTALAAGPASGVVLQVSLGSHLAPPAKECAIALATPTNGAKVIEAALKSGCIQSVEYADYPGLGRYVTCLDGVCEQIGTYWSYYVNEAQPGGGIDNTNGKATIRAGDVVEFAYVDYFTPCAEDPALCGFV